MGNEARLVSTSETGIDEHGTRSRAVAAESCTRTEMTHADTNSDGNVDSWSRRAQFRTALSRLFRTTSSYLRSTSSLREIRILGLLGLSSYGVYEVCHTVLGSTSMLTIIAFAPCFACLVLFSASIWRAVAKNVLRMLIVRPRCASMLQSWFTSTHITSQSYVISP